MFTAQDWLAGWLIGQGWLAGWLARTDWPALGNALLATEWLAGCPPRLGCLAGWRPGWLSGASGPYTRVYPIPWPTGVGFEVSI